MKEGYVTAKWTKFSISGAPGTGKSSFLKLLYNEDPPVHHDSTPIVATQEARKVDICCGVNSDSVWTKIDHKSLKKMIAEGIKYGTQHHKPEEHGPIENTSVNRLSSQKSVDQLTDQLQETTGSSDSKSATSTAEHQVLGQTFLPKSTVTQEIIGLLPQVKKSEELYKTHWIYGIDTGGQYAFLDIAPALLRYHSVNILTHKLTERLDDKATFLFSVEGNLIGEPDKKQITNIQFLKASFRSLASVDLLKLPNVQIKHVQEPCYIVLGTFLDKMLKSGESLKMKNKSLWSNLENFRRVTIKHSESEEELIFPLNTTERGNTEQKMAARIRNEICQYYIEAQIPIRWFLFQLELDRLHKSTESSIVSKSKCLEIGKSLQMKTGDVETALMYYHDLTIFLYFPKILPNVVFLHPQPLFNKLSDLIIVSFSKAVDWFKEKGKFLDDPGAHEDLKVQGTFKESLLTSRNSHLSEGFSSDFSPKDFIKLMISLFIFAPLPGEEKYFVPTVLPHVDLKQDIKVPFKKDVDPLILSWKMVPLPHGVFPALVVNLLQSSPKFTLPRAGASNNHVRYRNAITLCADAGDILLVDAIFCMEIYYSGPPNRCSAIRTAILNGICSIISSFHYISNIRSPDEYFYCKTCSNKHFCRINDTKKILTCNVTGYSSKIDEFRQLPWFLVESELKIL